MVLATKGLGLNPDVLSFAYADMSSVSSPRPTRKNINLGTERLVQFYSSDPEELGIEIEHSDDGYVRIVSTAGDGMYEGTVHIGDIVCEIAGVNMRRPITEHMWKLTTGLMKVAPRPIEVIVAAEENASSNESDEDDKLGAIGTLQVKKDAGKIDTENTQTSLVKQAMSVWQNLNLNGGSKEEYHDSPGNGTSDTASMSDGNEGSTVQTPDPFSDPERFGVERNIIFHTESLGVKLHRCQNEGIVQILHVDQNVSEEVRKGDGNGRLNVGDVIVEVGGVDLRHKFIGPLEWADMVYFVQNVGRPLDVVVVEDNHCARERDGDSGVTYNVKQELEEDARDEGDVENTGVTEVENDAKDEYEATNSAAIEASDHLISIEGEGVPEVDEEADAGLDGEVEKESAIEVVAVEEADAGLDGEVEKESVIEVVAVEEAVEGAAGKEVDQESAIELASSEEVVEEAVEEADHEVVLELDETLEGTDEEDSSIDDECYEDDDESEHKQKDDYGNEISDDELSEMMMSQVEQFEASNEKNVSFSVKAEEEEPVQEVEIKRTRQQIERELTQLPKFSPEWFSLKSELIELRASEGDLEQKRSMSSFYFRTHPNNKTSHAAASSVLEVPVPFLSKGTDSSLVSMESVVTSESSAEPPLTPASIIEEEDAFEVTMWAGPKDDKPKEDEVAFSTFGGSLFGMDDSDTEEPFTGGINFDAPPRVPVSDLFSHAFVVNRAGDVGSPLFVVKKTLPNQNKTNESSGYLQMETPRRQAQEAKIPNAKPALDMSKIALHQEMSLESAQSVESAWDTADFAKEVDAQADSFFLDSLCGDSMCESLINNSIDMRQKKEKPGKPRRKRLFGKLRKNKKKDEAKMLGYGNLDDDTEDYRSATAALALQKFKSKKTAEFTGFHPIDDEVDL